jgi:hypothetical protein
MSAIVRTPVLREAMADGPLSAQSTHSSELLRTVAKGGKRAYRSRWGRLGVRRSRAKAQLAAPDDGKGSTPVTLNLLRVGELWQSHTTMDRAVLNAAVDSYGCDRSDALFFRQSPDASRRPAP